MRRARTGDKRTQLGFCRSSRHRRLGVVGDLNLDGTASRGFFLHAHDGSLESDFCGRGCARPPGDAPAAGGGFIVILRNGLATASASSWLNAARSVADRKRTSVSTARVARRLPVSFARRTRSPTSRTTRAAANEIARGKPIDFPIRINGDRAQGARRNDVGSGRRHEQPFRQPAPLAFLGQPHQPVRFQRACR